LKLGIAESTSSHAQNVRERSFWPQGAVALENRAFADISRLRYLIFSGVAAVSNRFAVHNDSEQSLPEVLSLDPLYLFVSYLEWRIEGNLASLGELLAALAAANEEVHLVAKSLITENSACPILPDRNQDCTTH
jgi:hypothetical protein